MQEYLKKQKMAAKNIIIWQSSSFKIIALSRSYFKN